MPDPKSKLPRSVVVLNVIMILLIVVICILVFSLTYSDAVLGEQTTTSAITTTLFDAEFKDGVKETAEPEATTATTKASSSVSMTKRTTEPTEPDETPVESQPQEQPTEESAPPVIDTAYDKSYFANDLFIGDSISTGIYLYNKLDMKNVAASVGYTPYKAYSNDIDLPDGTSGTAVEYAKRMQPTRIFIMLGSNGLASASAMEDSYSTLIDKLSVACPDTAIYCISVSPVTEDSTGAANGGITNDMVISFNTFVKSMCTDKGIRYIGFYSEITDSDGYFMEEYAEADGLHFKGITYDRMLNYIQNTIA